MSAEITNKIMQRLRNAIDAEYERSDRDTPHYEVVIVSLMVTNSRRWTAFCTSSHDMSALYKVMSATLGHIDRAVVLKYTLDYRDTKDYWGETHDPGKPITDEHGGDPWAEAEGC